jgi:hypothetical protein
MIMRQDTNFYTDGKIGTFPITVITGTCRSGKTLLGNLLATSSRVEYADEPWTAMLLPMLVSTGKVDPDLAVGWLGAFVSELFNDLVLLRSANFRPDDLSTIWTKKNPHEIFFRLTKLRTRLNVLDYVKAKNLSLTLTLAECGPFADFIMAAMGHPKIVHVIRNGFHVAADVVEKGWLSDAQLLKPSNAQLFANVERSGVVFHLPWWVDVGDEQMFMQFSEYERGLYYWCSLIEKTLPHQEACRMYIVKYADLVSDPRVVFDLLSTKLSIPPGPLTDECIAQIAHRTQPVEPENITPDLNDKTSLLNNQLGI